MFTFSSHICLIPVILAAFMLLELGCPSAAKAQWHRSNAIDESTLSTQELIVYGLATVGAIILLSKIVKSDKKSKVDRHLKDGADSTSTQSSLYFNYQHLHNKDSGIVEKNIRGTNSQIPLNLFLTMNNYGFKKSIFMKSI